MIMDAGADKYCVNNFGINVLHTAAQGDQPLSLLYFKEQGLDLRSTDNRNSTPLHWACYSKSEVALVYLLAWVQKLDDQDVEGYTPLHLAVKSVEQLKTTRPVRALLMRGAPRNVQDQNGEVPADLIHHVTTEWLQKTLRNELDEPRSLDCLMIKTPLKKV
jgi:ankyrin repeat protein